MVVGVVEANQLEELELGDSQALVVVDMPPEDIGLQVGEEASLVAKVIQTVGHPLEVDKQGLQKELQVVEELPLIYFFIFLLINLSLLSMKTLLFNQSLSF